AGWVSIRIEQVVLFVKVGAMETDARAFHSHPARESSGSLVTAHTVTRRRRAGRSVQAAGRGARGTASAISSPGKPPKLPEVGPVPRGSSDCRRAAICPICSCSARGRRESQSNHVNQRKQCVWISHLESPRG